MTETEIERLVVRLVGDGSEYQAMLKESVRGTKQAGEQIEQAGAGMEHGMHLSHRSLTRIGHAFQHIAAAPDGPKGLEHSMMSISGLAHGIGHSFGPMGIAAGLAVGIVISKIKSMHEHFTEARREAGKAFIEMAADSKGFEESLAKMKFDSLKKNLGEAIEPTLWDSAFEAFGTASQAAKEKQDRITEALKKTNEQIHEFKKFQKSDLGKQIMLEIKGSKFEADLQGQLAQVKDSMDAIGASPGMEKLIELRRRNKEAGGFGMDVLLHDLEDLINKSNMLKLEDKFKEQQETLDMLPRQVEVYRLKLEGAAKTKWIDEANKKELEDFWRSSERVVESAGWDEARKQVDKYFRALPDLTEAEKQAMLQQAQLEAAAKEAGSAFLQLSKEVENFGKFSIQVAADKMEEFGKIGQANQLRNLEGQRTWQQMSKEVDIFNAAMGGATKAQLAYLSASDPAAAVLAKWKSLMDDGKRVTEEFLEPIDKFKRTHSEMSELLKAGTISQDTYAKAVAKAAKELEGERQQLQGVASGTAEARAHVLDYMEALKLRKTLPKPKDEPGAAAGGAEAKARVGQQMIVLPLVGQVMRPVDLPGNQNQQPALNQAQQLEILKQIRDVLMKKDNKEQPIKLNPADFGGRA